MIRIGLGQEEKQHEVTKYLIQHTIKKVFVFYPEKFPLLLESIDIPIEHVKYTDIIMYKFFYRLLEEIDNNVLLIFNECLRTQKRSDLTYNCAHHYCNQTSHKIVFEYFPFIENNADFMILLDLLNKGRYKGKGFAWEMLHNEDILCRPRQPTLETIDLRLPPEYQARYEREKQKLFDNLGEADPDTIPRRLHIFAGNFKRQAIRPDLLYVARNDRFKLPNVIPYHDVTRPGEYMVIDFPHRRIDFNDFLKITGMTTVKFVNSGLKVDLYYIDEFKRWTERLGEFYAQAGIYPKNRS